MSAPIEMWKVTVELAKHYDNIYWQEVRHFVGILVLLGGGAGAALITTGLPPSLRLGVSGALLLLGAALAYLGRQVVGAEGKYIGFATRTMKLAEKIAVADAKYPEDIHRAWIEIRRLDNVESTSDTPEGPIRVTVKRLFAGMAVVFLIFSVLLLTLAVTCPESVYPQIEMPNAGQQGATTDGPSGRR